MDRQIDRQIDIQMNRQIYIRIADGESEEGAAGVLREGRQVDRQIDRQKNR